MAEAKDFTIETNEKGNFVVIGMNYYQDIDFVNGGFIKTREAAIAVRNALIDSLNGKPAPIVEDKTLEGKISKLEEKNEALEAKNEELQAQIEATQLAIAELAELALGGV